MKSSKLIQLLKVLDYQEFKQFYKYLQSSYFNQSEDVLRLYDYIRPHYPAFNSLKLERTKVFTHLYPEKIFNGPRLRNLILKITQILEKYLLHLEYEQDPFLKKKALTHIYGKRNLNVIFKQKTEDLLKELEEQPLRDAKYYYDRYCLLNDFYFHLNTPRDGVTKEKLIAAYHQLNYFFAIERLRFGMEFKNREKIFSDDFDFFQSDQLEFIPPENNTIYDLFKKVVDFITSPSEEIYFETKALFLGVIDNLQKEDQQRILFSLLNFALGQIAKKGKIFTQESFNLYQLGLSKSVFISEQNYFPGPTFLNIVHCGSSLKEIDWTKNFVQEYETFLDEKAKVNYYPIAVASLSFYQDDFSETVNVINASKFSNPLIAITAKLLALRAYYELCLKDSFYGQLLQFHIKAFEKFLSRDHNLEETKVQSYLNFIYIFKKFLKIEQKRSIDKVDILNLKDLLETIGPVSAKPWLQKKIESLSTSK